MDPFNVQQQVSMTLDDDEILCSGSESEEHDSSSSNPFAGLKHRGMIKLGETDLDNEIVAKSFLWGLGSLRADAEVVAIHKSWSCNSEKKARLESFRIFSDAVAAKCGGDAGMKFAWYGGTVDEIYEIVSHGFSRCSKHIASESFGVGVYLSPGRFSIDCVSSSVIDRNGLRHMLLCRVILGKMEEISRGSTQFHPSSLRYDTGVDNLLAPRKYIVWAALMNSYIQPIYVISFKAPHPNDLQIKSANALKPTSPWMCFPTLMAVLSRFLDPTKMDLIVKCYHDFLRKKITRAELINRVRDMAGDKLLIAVIKKYRRNETMELS